MKEYPKIQTLFTRDPSNLSRVVEGSYARPEFEVVQQWYVTEKIHGMNVRLHFYLHPEVDTWVYRLGGRTDRAQLSIPQLDFLALHANRLVLPVRAQAEAHGVTSMTLYAELYGKGVQKEGAVYDPEGLHLAFFDALVNDEHWLGPEAFYKLAAELELPSPRLFDQFDWWTTADVVTIVKDDYPLSAHSGMRELHIEGVVARPRVDLFNAKGDRVMFKLKGSDFGRKMRV